MGDRLVFAFRHFPLAEVHPFAIAAALAAEAAGLHGQFWPMHDRLFAGDEPQPAPGGPARLRRGDRGTAGEGVWPATQFVEDRVEADFNSGVRSGVRGTPTLFVDGVRYRGDVTVRALLAAPRWRRPGATGLRIATFNLLHGLDVRSNRVDLDAVAAAIDNLDADVVAVQEVDRGLAAARTSWTRSPSSAPGWTGRGVRPGAAR